MMTRPFPAIDPVATGANIRRLRRERGLTVRELQAYFGFEEPRAIYKWQRGDTLPAVDHLYALGALLEVPMEDILVPRAVQAGSVPYGQQADRAGCPSLFSGSYAGRYGRGQRRGRHFSAARQALGRCRDGGDVPWHRVALFRQQAEKREAA